MHRIFVGSNSYAHSQSSSLAEDCVDSYVPVQSGMPREEYIDMEQNLHHANNTSSMSSITSGTPSTDLRFAEYQLDKVVSHFTPDDDDPKYVQFKVQCTCILLVARNYSCNS